MRYDFYKDAAIARGLLEHDLEWERCLEDANCFMMPAQLRELFASILHESAPARPARLWDTFKGALSEDILHRLRQVRCIAYLDPGFMNACVGLQMMRHI